MLVCFVAFMIVLMQMQFDLGITSYTWGFRYVWQFIAWSIALYILYAIANDWPSLV